MENINSQYKYATVRFTHTNDVASVPVSWISSDDKSDFCVWPKCYTGNRSRIIRLSPKEDWKRYEVEILGRYDTYDEAFKREIKEAKSSSSEAEKGRGKRKIKKKQFDDCIPVLRDTDDEELNSAESTNHTESKSSYPRYYKLDKENVLPQLYEQILEKFLSSNAPLEANISNNAEAQPFISLVENTTSAGEGIVLDIPSTSYCASSDIHVDNKEDEGEDEEEAEENASAVSETISNTTFNSKLSDVSNNNKALKEFEINQILNYLVEIKATMNLLLEKVCTQPTAQPGLETITVAAEDKLPNLPLNTIDDLLSLENLLEGDKTVVAQFASKLLLIGGHNYKNYIYRCLKHIFSNSLASKCSLRGKKNNFQIDGLQILSLLYDSVLRGFQNITRIQFEAAVMEWFKHGRQRSLKEKNFQ